MGGILPQIIGGIVIGVGAVGGYFGFQFFQDKDENKPVPAQHQNFEEHDESVPHTHDNDFNHGSSQVSSGKNMTASNGNSGVVSNSDTTDTVDISSYVYGNASITTDGSYKYIVSNGLPEHETGDFPNPGNPNAITEQDHSFRVTLNPTYSSSITEASIPGVALNGIPLEPGTAESYNEDISWSIEAYDASGEGGLGIDWSNAHVQPNGTYHYHGSPNGLLESALEDQSGDLIQIAWASDGFPIYYSQSNAYSSSWQLKDGTRPDGPGGKYDGTYTQDFEYVSGSGDLDECNGAFVGGSYGYYLTDSFPYIQRCVHGIPDESFSRFGGGSPTQGGQSQGRPQNAIAGGAGNTPPPAATSACASKSENTSCSFSTPNGNISGTCKTTPDTDSLACVPAGQR